MTNRTGKYRVDSIAELVAIAEDLESELNEARRELASLRGVKGVGTSDCERCAQMHLGYCSLCYMSLMGKLDEANAEIASSQDLARRLEGELNRQGLYITAQSRTAYPWLGPPPEPPTAPSLPAHAEKKEEGDEGNEEHWESRRDRLRSSITDN